MIQKTLILVCLAVFTLLFVMMFLNMKNWYAILPIPPVNQFELARYVDWVPFSSQSGGFDVEFPVVPQHFNENKADNQGTLLNYDMYVAQSVENTTYLISLITFPNKAFLGNPEQMMETTIHELATATPSGRLVEQHKISYLNQVTVEFQFETDTQETRGRIFIIDRTLYLLTAIFEKGQYKNEDYSYFVNSFQLIK